MMGRSNLILLRAGDSSLHPNWLRLEGVERNWDLHISYFGNKPDPFGELPEGVTLSHEKGSKYFGIVDCLGKHDHFSQKYQYISLPDDDLQIIDGSWSRFFDLMQKTNAVLGQPSLDTRSFYGHGITLQRKRYDYREVTFVEVMMPTFRWDFFEEASEYFLMNNSSWGLDFIISDLAMRQNGKMVIADNVSFLHTRRVGKGSQYNGMQSTPQQDMEETFERLNLVFPKNKTALKKSISAVLHDGKIKSGWYVNRRSVRAQFYRVMRDIMKVNTFHV